MRRRVFAALVICAAAIWPAGATAQQDTLPVVGFLSSASARSFSHLTAAFREGLARAGVIEGESVSLVFRWAEGDYARLPALARELVDLNVSVIVASGGDRPALAAKSATSQIPIVFTGSDDPVKFGLVETLGRPGGNVTGASMFTSEVEIKKLELLREVSPGAEKVGMLINPDNPAAETDTGELTALARTMGLEPYVADARSVEDIAAAFSDFAAAGIDALLVGHDPYFNDQRRLIVELAARLGVPAVYEHREFVEAGGLMAYGNPVDENYRLAGDYVAKILAGADPAELPVQQPTRFELTVNLRTAAALGIAIAPSVLVRADDVIE